jgi:5-formyltetrahydrofolate cyclo-ligase
MRTKEEHRHHIKQQLKIEEPQLLARSKKITDYTIRRLTHHVARIPSTAIALYKPMRYEPDITAVFAWGIHHQVALALPYVVTYTAMEMRYSRSLQQATREEQERLPRVTQPTVAHPLVMVVPSVGVTATGHRLGSGKGYYDRFLSAWKSAIDDGSLVLYTTVFDLQVIDAAYAPEEHDVPMHHLVTERGIWDCRQQRWHADVP